MHSPIRSILLTCRLTCLLCIAACHHNASGSAGPDAADPTNASGSTATPSGPASGPDSTQKNSADTTHQEYFPIADYIRSEISYVDSTPLAILKYTNSGRHTDSVFIKSAEFHRLAQEFLAPELAKDRFQKEFTEKSFQDGTTGYMEFLYATGDSDLPLQRADVLVAHGDGPDQVKTIYLEKNFPSAGILVTQKLLWTSKKNFQITTTTRQRTAGPATGGSAPITRQIKVVWDATPTAAD